MKRAFVMRVSISVIVCLVALMACRSSLEIAGEYPTKREVMQALKSACGKELANKYFGEWLREYKIESESDLDSEVCSEILEQINRGNVSPAVMKQMVSATRERLLSNVDHPSLLFALREAMRNRESYQNDPTWKHFTTREGRHEASFISGSNSNLPAVILELQAEVLICENETITVVFQPGFANMGFIAYAKDIDSVPDSGGRKHTKIIDGLWFYESKNRYF